jgi:hypothetical protein
LVTNRCVTYHLNLVADPRNERTPACPVVFGQRVFDGHDREGVDPLGVDVGHLLAGQLTALEAVDAVVEELGAGHVKGHGDIAADSQPSALDSG